MAKKQSTPVDPELRRQLDAAEEDQPVQAAFTLRAPAGNPLIEADVVRKTVDRIIKFAQEKSGKAVRDFHVLPYVQSFTLAAPAGAIREILNHGDIASAMANVQSEEMAIKPVPRSRAKSTSRGGGKTRKGG